MSTSETQISKTCSICKFWMATNQLSYRLNICTRQACELENSRSQGRGCSKIWTFQESKGSNLQEIEIKHIYQEKAKSQWIPYLKSVIPANYPDAEDMFIIIQKFQSFSTCGGRKPWPNIYFSKTPNLKISQHNTPADERLVLLWLIKSPHQWPNLLDTRNISGISKP